MDGPPCCCAAPRVACNDRRILLKLAGATLAAHAGLPAAAADDAQAADTPRAGDWLLPADTEGATPLGADVLSFGAGPLIVVAFDPLRRRVRSGAGRDRILLIRLDPAAMDEATRARAAGGVLAYSAVCTHGACFVRDWRPREQRLHCPCHFSQYDPLRSAAVTAGPAPRALPNLALREEDGRLVLGSGFSAAPGHG